MISLLIVIPWIPSSSSWFLSDIVLFTPEPGVDAVVDFGECGGVCISMASSVSPVSVLPVVAAVVLPWLFMVPLRSFTFCT